MRVCVLYDCLFPWTVGGAERWYRNLSERLAAEGHEVTYLTRLQWDPEDPPAIPGVRVVAVAPATNLYGSDGNRRIAPPLRYGLGVLRHLLRHGREYDVVHTASFPYFSVLAAAAARWRGGYRVVVDWFEVWSRAYWRAYLGRIGGAVGHAVQSACARVPQKAFCFSRMHAERLRASGLRGDVELLAGLYDGRETAAPAVPRAAEPFVVFAGRHIREKRVPAVVAGVVAARRRLPGLRAVIYGDGPERPQVLDAIARAGAAEFVTAPGFVASEEIEEALRDALCMLLPSSREGYGLIVVEAAAHGCPSVVVQGADNAAVELIDDGVNGFVTASAEPGELADAIVRVCERGESMRWSTYDWFTANADRLSLERSLERVLASYAGGRS